MHAETRATVAAVSLAGVLMYTWLSSAYWGCHSKVRQHWSPNCPYSSA